MYVSCVRRTHHDSYLLILINGTLRYREDYLVKESVVLLIKLITKRYV